MTFDQLIQQQQPHVERVVHDLARRHFLSSTEVDEFRGVVERALERNDYELLRAFDGRSTWETYLTTVVTRQFYLFQAALWGQWRPSALAIRLGAAAILLEELVVRDHFPVADAVEWMRTTHRVDLPRHRILQMAEQLHLTPAKPERTAGAARAADPQLRHALRDAMALVSPDDRLILELRFRDRQPLTRIAAVLNTDARPLQRRIDTAKSVIRQSLLTQGIATDDVEALLQGADGDATETQRQKWWQFALSRSSR